MSPGWTGRHPRSSQVCTLDAGWSIAKICPSQPNSSAGTEAVDTFRWRPITSAMSRVGTPSSPTAWSLDPALGAGDRDQAGDEAVTIAVAVHRPGQPHNGRPDTPRRHAKSRLGVRHPA